MVSSVDAEATESAGGAAVGSDAPIAFADTNATATTSERHRDKRHRDKRHRDKRHRDKRHRDKALPRRRASAQGRPAPGYGAVTI
jgi:hypothetical protein